MKHGTNKSAVTSLTLGLFGWALYILSWCFDLSLGILLAAITGGISSIISSVMDLIPLALWIVGIVMGHRALIKIKHGEGVGRNQALWGLVLNYMGVFITTFFLILVAFLLFAGIGVGLLDKIIPFINK